MDREILFRGKRVIDGKWVESCCPLGEMHSGTVTYDFDSKTVCQYTGLTDKNGRKIFEGDIVEVTEGSLDCDNGKGNVIFYEGLWYVDGEPQNSLYDLRNIGDHEVEVIGNIFDNPELLEGGIE